MHKNDGKCGFLTSFCHFCGTVCTEVGAFGVGGQRRGFLESPVPRGEGPGGRPGFSGRVGFGATFEVEFLVSHSNHKGVV